MAATVSELKRTLAEARAYLERVLDAAYDRAETQVYSDGLTWNVRQIAVHLADADRGHNNQVMAFAEGREIIPPDFDIERYNRRTTEKRADMSLTDARRMLQENRAALEQWLDGLDEPALEKVGRHASLRMMSIREVLENMAAHERAHADDIVQALQLKLDI